MNFQQISAGVKQQSCVSWAIYILPVWCFRIVKLNFIKDKKGLLIAQVISKIISNGQTIEFLTTEVDYLTDLCL